MKHKLRDSNAPPQTRGTPVIACHFEGGTTEKSASAAFKSNRFLTPFEMTGTRNCSQFARGKPAEVKMQPLSGLHFRTAGRDGPVRASSSDPPGRDGPPLASSSGPPGNSTCNRELKRENNAPPKHNSVVLCDFTVYFAAIRNNAVRFTNDAQRPQGVERFNKGKPSELHRNTRVAGGLTDVEGRNA